MMKISKSLITTDDIRNALWVLKYFLCITAVKWLIVELGAVERLDKKNEAFSSSARHLLLLYSS